MEIKKLTASFGNLNNRELQLSEGLNIVHAPNEVGKSTWCGFIRAMLYGINTSERDRMEKLSEKTKYRPWSGANMEGRMDITAYGRDITIQRTNLGQVPMKKLSVVYSKTGQEVLELANESIGETLTGVPEKVFERSAFIRQTGIRISQTGELEQRISSLVSSGEEGISCTETDATLRTWLRKRRHNNTGMIPKLEGELRAAQDMLRGMEQVSDKFGKISLDVDRVTARRNELAEDLRIHEELEGRAQRAKIQQAQKKVRDLEREVSYLQSSLTRNRTEITREMVAKARENYDKLSALTVQYTNTKEEKEVARRELQLIEEEKLSSVFEGKTVAEAREIVKGATEDSLEADRAKDYKIQRYSVPISVLSVFALATLVASFMLKLPLYFLTAISAVGAIVLAVLLLRKKRAAQLAEQKRVETLSKYKSGSIEDLTNNLEDYERLCGKAEELTEKHQGTDKALEAALAEMQKYKDGFEASVKAFAPDTQGLEEAFKAMSSTEQLTEKLKTARAGLVSAQTLFEGLSGQYSGDWSRSIPKDGLQEPIRSKMETSYDLKRQEKELEDLKATYAAVGGELRALGDPMILEAKVNAVSERLEELRDQYNSLALAIEVLDEANSEIQTRFSPKLGRKAGQYLEKLTGGKYKRIVLDKDLLPQAEEYGASVGRELLYLSGGTVDQIYLALRLAICEMVLPEEDLCPIILDDVLIYFDDERLASALELLREISQKRQVIIFTCHKREVEYFENGGANIVCMTNKG